MPSILSLFGEARPVSRGLPVVGLIPGEGVGPALVAGASRVLDAVTARTGRAVAVRSFDGPAFDDGMPAEVGRFCGEVFAEGGAVLAGPGGGRFVYDLRARFDLFCKIVPVRPDPSVAASGPLRPEITEGTDLIVVREIASGAYFGEANEVRTAEGGRAVEHRYRYTEAEVARILRVAARLAAARTGRMMVATKAAAIPGIGALWASTARAVAAEEGVDCTVQTADYVAYALVAQPRSLDVIVACNLFGDVLADVTAAVLGSRGISFSGNYAPNGDAVYQTNHGAAFDMAGKDLANPGAQILALAMLLRESLGMAEEAERVERAQAAVWAQGVATADLAHRARRIVGTTEMFDRVIEALDSENSVGQGA